MWRSTGKGSINFIVNAEPNSLAQRFAREHGPSVCAMAFRVKDAARALRDAVAAGARRFVGRSGPMELNIPAIEGVGGSLIYLVDRQTGPSIYDIDFVMDPGADMSPAGAGLEEIDHLTHNVGKGRMDYFQDFYHRVFNFHEHQYFDITGEYTGSPAVRSPLPAARSASRSTNRSTRAGAIRSTRSRSSSSSIAARAFSTSRCARTTSSRPGTGCTPTASSS